MLKKFDTQVQYLKYKVLREVARYAWEDRLNRAHAEIPDIIVDGKEATMRCCVYKEKAIVGERIDIAMGGDDTNPNIIEVLKIACDECPLGGYSVTESCRGCLAHRCQDACRRDAISFDKNKHAVIDKSRCVECGKCAEACPYGAIINHKRPCVNACKVNAISMDDENKALIDNDKCIACGACSYMCPFGAIMDKSFMLDAINMIKDSGNNEKYKVYAVVAPSIAGQFSYAKLGQVVTGIKALGFFSVVEAALGADMTAYLESRELAEKEREKGFLTTSCCPAFVDYIHKHFPTLVDHISHNLSPLGEIAKYIKSVEPDCKVVFIGPCTAKKAEVKYRISEYVDCALTFEELQALFDSRNLDIASMESDVLDNASYFGRIFARSGGVADAVGQALKEHGLNDFEYKPYVANGIEECRMALMRASKNALPNNLIEGMACYNGCIGGAGCLTHGEKNKSEVDKYGREAMEKDIYGATSLIRMQEGI